MLRLKSYISQNQYLDLIQISEKRNVLKKIFVRQS